MKHTLKILIPILLILALLIGACWFFLIARRDLTESVFTYWGNHFYNNGRYGRAITCYKLAMHFAPKDAELAIWLSNAYKRSGNYTKAEYTLVNAIRTSSLTPRPCSAASPTTPFAPRSTLCAPPHP